MLIVREWLCQFLTDSLWQLGQKSAYSVRDNLFGQFSDTADQQSCSYSDDIS